MERNSETKILSFSKGMTNMPSDLLSEDTELQVSSGFIFKDGEMKPIQKEKILFDGDTKLPTLFVHKYNNYKHYIALNDNNTLVWYNNENSIVNITNAPIVGDSIQIQAIGNTLVVNSSEGLGYYLWKPENANYKYMGAKIPEPEVRFRFLLDKSFIQSDAINLEGICDKKGDGCYIGDGKQSSYNDAVLGVYAENKKKICEKGGFCNPFFIRYAVELYDGSFTNISIPVLMMPLIGHHSYWLTSKADREDDKYYLLTWYMLLRYTLNTDYSEWTDLVKSVTLFASRGVDNYKTSSDQTLSRENEITKKLTVICGGGIQSDGSITEWGDNVVEEHTYTTPVTSTEVGSGTDVHHDALHEAMVLSTSVLENLKRDSIFYKIKELPLDNLNTWTTAEFEDNTLENLTSLQKLDADYYSNCEWGGKSIYIYNQRLHVMQPFRKSWEGAGQLFACSYAKGLNNWHYVFDVYVYIRTNSGERVVHKEIEGNELLFRTYFFYPDPKAYKAVLVADRNKGHNYWFFQNGEGQYKVKEIPLKESTTLNGAYWFGEIPSISTTRANIEWGANTEPPTENNGTISYGNQILTSDVNNPWVFAAKGNNSIGNGEIINVASQTTALSQGQFGQYPLIAFCTDGIWALKTDNEGLYSSVHPMSREVCNNANSITETDGYIFFTTEKGLMVVNGSQVTCVSERMNGKISNGINLRDCLDNCFIAYDYRDSMLWIISPSNTTAFVYNIKDGTFGQKEIPNITRVINDYPDTLLQDTDGRIYSLLERPNINEDTRLYSGSVITRPMKLGGSLMLKSVRGIKHLLDTKQGELSLEVLASNTTKEWCPLYSLKGKPWSYFVFKYTLSNFKACDSFAGTIVDIQNRRKIKY